MINLSTMWTNPGILDQVKVHNTRSLKSLTLFKYVIKIANVNASSFILFFFSMSLTPFNCCNAVMDVQYFG